MDVRFYDMVLDFVWLMPKFSCNNLYISSEDVEIYQLYKVDLVHCY